MQYPGWKHFIKLCREAEQHDMLNDLIKFFFTAEEQEQMGKRVLLVQALLKGELTQREISKQFEISISKITRGSNMLKSGSKNVKQFLKKELN